LVTITLALVPVSVVAADDDVSASAIRAAVAVVLHPQTNRSASRLARVSNIGGEVTVVFAMSDEDDDPLKIGARGREDALQVMRSIYASADAASVAIKSATVLGTYAVYNKFGTSREIPLLRLGLWAEHADRLATATAANMAAVMDQWWQHAEVDAPQAQATPAEATPPRTSISQPPSSPAPSPPIEVRRKLDTALVHLNTALFALSVNDVRVARSQFKQYFDVWDDLDSVVQLSYPDRYAIIDTAINRVELALLHGQPEDLTTARDGLHALRAQLAEIAADSRCVTESVARLV
jgi:hypothetical protein